MQRYRFTDGRVDRIVPPPAAPHSDEAGATHIHVHLPGDGRDANNGAPGEKNLALARGTMGLRDQPRPNGPNGPNPAKPEPNRVR
jgi:hypothetical protein